MAREGFEPPTPRASTECSTRLSYQALLSVRPGGFEPPPCRVSGDRSNQAELQARIPASWVLHCWTPLPTTMPVVGKTGFEPVAPATRRQCSDRAELLPVIGAVGIEPTTPRLRAGSST